MGMGKEWRWNREPLRWHTGLEIRAGSITPSADLGAGQEGEPPPPHGWHRDGGTVTPPGCRAALLAATASAAALHEAPLPAPTAAGGNEAKRGRGTAQTRSQEGLLPTAPAWRGSAAPQPPNAATVGDVGLQRWTQSRAVGTQTGLDPVRHTKQRLHPNTVP